MRYIPIILVIGIFTLLSSCKGSLKIYFYNLDKTKVDDGELWGDSRFLLFLEENERIETKVLKESVIAKELNTILKAIKSCNPNIPVFDGLLYDDGYYEYAFVFNKQPDTLYTNDLFDEWRYKDQKMKVKNSMKDLLKTIIPGELGF
ncbi:MAG: hypothetical protein R3D00_29420 [Bacteroidia bacterium]